MRLVILTVLDATADFLHTGPELKLAALALTLLALTGCAVTSNVDADEPSKLELTMDRQTYAPGDPFVLTLANRTGQTYSGEELCYVQLERWEHDGYRIMRPQFGSDVRCIDMPPSHRPGSAATLRAEFPVEIEPGTYRYALTLWPEDGGREKRFEVATPPFDVAAP